MPSPLHRLLAALLLAASVPAAAQGPPLHRPAARQREPKPAPVTGGAPTTVENVHLPTEQEIRDGREAAAEVEKVYKLVSSGPQYERLQRVGREVAGAILAPDIVAEYRRLYRVPKKNDRSRRLPFEYTFKLLDTTKEINAFSLPGGPVFVTRGLLDYAASDSELAGVLAHECAHALFHHQEQMARKGRKISLLQLGMLAALIAGAAGANTGQAALPILMGGSLVYLSAMTGYSQELETEADRIAVWTLTRTTYHPVGVLTMMRKLARDDALRGYPDAGVYQTHPYSNQRVEAIRRTLVALGYSVDASDLRTASGSFRLEAAPLRVNGRPACELRLNGEPIFTAAAGEEGLDPVARGERIVRQFESLFGSSVTFNDVKQSPDRKTLTVRGVPVLRVYPEDAAAMGGDATTDRAYRAIIKALWNEKLDGRS